VVAATERGGYRISKRKSLEKIDGCVALAMAADRAVTMRNDDASDEGTLYIY
jgi:phage terminase large subunit-like protein